MHNFIVHVAAELTALMVWSAVSSLWHGWRRL